MRLTLRKGAEKLWGPFYEETQGRAEELGEDGGSTWAKLAGVCARIALVFELAAWAGAETPGPLPSKIARGTMRSAIRLALWFGREALRVHALLDRSGNDRELDGFEERIARRGGSVSVRDWQRMRSKRRAAEAREELQRLVEAGRAQWEPRGGSAGPVLVLTGRQPGKAPREAPPTATDPVSKVSVSEPSEQDSTPAEKSAGNGPGCCPSAIAEPGCSDASGNAPTENEPERGAGPSNGLRGDRSPWSEVETLEAFEERAAIREHDGGMTRHEAEQQALFDIRRGAKPWH
jgi:hypothetical protein